MKPIHLPVVAFVSIVIGLAAGPSPAQEQPLRFVHALQANGYGDMAVEYLNSLKDQPDLPRDIREVWDLEMSKSLKAAASVAFDTKEYESLMADSQKYLAKFIKEKPNHPDATIAMAAWGDFLVKRALESLRLAKTVEGKDKAQYTKHLDEARKVLTEAQGKFQESLKKFKARLAEMPLPKPSARRNDRSQAGEARQAMESNLYEVQFQLALIDYYLAQTYSDPKNPARAAALEKAAKAFDDIFQLNRGTVTGLFAHMWHGKTAEELGKLQDALDIYDEVLSRAPDPNERAATTGLEPLFAQVEQFRLLIVAKQKPTHFLPEATAWLKDYYRRLRQTDGYQGIALDVAKALVAKAKAASGPEKAKLLSEAMKVVTDSSAIRSDHTQEFFALRRELAKELGRNLEINTFNDGVAAGDLAVANSEWEKALSAYKKGLEIADNTKLKNPDAIATVREAMGRVQYMIACDLFNKGKLNECIDMVAKIVFDEDHNVKKESAAAAQASALSVSAALNLYVAAPADKKPAALERLMKVAEFTEKNWPDKPEADDARMARGQAKLAVGKVREAIEVFDRVNPKSERYSTAMYWSGQNYWRLYVTAKLGKDAPDKDQMAADRAKAVERLTAALSVLKKQFQPGKPLPKYMLDTQLLLAEVCNEGGDAKQAAELYQPLVDAIKAEKPEAFDNNTIRIFLGAVRAYCTLNDLDKAGAVSGVLVELGPDTLPINDVLIQFAKLLNLECKKADARVIELENSTNAVDVAAAKKRLASVQDLLGKTLVKLSQRKELNLGHMIFIGQTLNAIGMTNEASEQFQAILKRMDTDEAFAAVAKKAVSLIRSELLKTLRKQGKFDEALKQVDQLIEANPNALALLMEKGRILEAWAEKNPAKFDDAVKHWAKLRDRLQPMRKKPDEYYEVMYNVAKCLVREAEKSTDKAKKAECLKKAEQVLKSPMILSPKLNGPDTVAKYKSLLNKAITMQGRSPDAKGEKKP